MHYAQYKKNPIMVSKNLSIGSPTNLHTLLNICYNKRALYWLRFILNFVFKMSMPAATNIYEGKFFLYLWFFGPLLETFVSIYMSFFL